MAKNPKKLFRIDSFGAFVSGLLLFIIVKNFNSFFNLPLNFTYLLISIAVSLFFYSGFCSLYVSKNKALKAIYILIIANSTYCIITAYFIIKFSNQLSFLAISYFIIEIIIIQFLIQLEYKTSKKLTNEHRTLE